MGKRYYSNNETQVQKGGSMNIIKRKRSGFLRYLTILVVPLALMLIYGCSGSDSYDLATSQGTQPQVMIDAATLNNWVVNGYGTDANGYNKLVILDVDSASNDHIPGSYNHDTGDDVKATRSNGVSFTISQVPTKEAMDALIQRTGIDAHTVVALVGNGTMMNVGRAYFNFRYWGFPKERLKVLNGTKNATYRDAGGYALSSVATPLPTPSTYSTDDLTPNVSVRASLEDMIAYAQDNDPFTVVIDARSADEYNGVARKTTGATSGTYVAFEGHVATAEHQEYVTLHQGGNRANPLLPEDELIAAMTTINMDEDSTGISYCKTSWRATIQFLALDAVLGWDAKIYDGAWIQWGLMASNDPAVGGALEDDSPWRTDNTLSESINYNRKVVGPLVGADSFSSEAKDINENDKAICAGAGTLPANRAVDVMIDPATLMGWVDGGYSDPEGYGYTKMVVLHVDSATGYGAGHVPGAFNLNTAVDLSKTRNNGIADTVSQVADRDQMDALIQRTGIDANTVIVFTTSPGNFNMMNLGRAYFNFRYWGFPKERLRILDGNTTTHYAAVDDLSTTTPADVVSAYSVCDLVQDSSVDEVRASYEEMFDVAGDDDDLTVIADARSADEYNGVIGKTSVGGGAYVAFEGHARTAEHQEYVTLLSDGKLLPEADLMDAMTAIGADATTTVYTYCRTSWRAAVNFMALDAVLNWPVKIYDGAWIQWGQMATNDSSIDGSLDPTSPWRADNSDRTESLSYNKGPIDPLGANSYAPHANLINAEDAGTGAAAGGSGAGPGGGSSLPSAPGYN